MTTVATKRSFVCRLLQALAFLALFGAATAHAQRASISVSPTRLEFDERNRSAELDVINRGSETRVFRISLVHMKMTADGRLIEAAPDDVAIADDFVRFSPRQVTLRPGVTQKVRVMARTSSGTPAGEYRSHLHFQAIPQPDRATGGPDDSVQLRLKVVGAVSIPLIVRRGELDATVRIDGASLAETPDGEPALAVEMSRMGERSVYGDVEVFYARPGQTRAKRVGVVRGIAIYTPNEDRTVGVVLRPEAATDFDAGRLVVIYRQPRDRGRGVIARATVELQ